MKSVSVDELDKLLNDDDHDEVLLDVRTPAEYEGKHIKGAENTPLSNIDEAIEHLKNIGTVYVSCGTGARSQQACSKLSEHGINVVNMEGGLMEWARHGLPTEGSGKRVIPIIRQVMIVAGSLVVLGIVLGDLVSPYWLLLSLFVGSGLLFAGVSGICTMSMILAKMPWNKGSTCSTQD